MQFELVAGAYNVRLYATEDDGVSKYRTTTPAKIEKDGWVGLVYCVKGTPGFQVAFK